MKIRHRSRVEREAMGIVFPDAGHLSANSGVY
jgi:hypothetical protein